jgi:hypothetical protein
VSLSAERHLERGRCVPNLASTVFAGGNVLCSYTWVRTRRMPGSSVVRESPSIPYHVFGFLRRRTHCGNSLPQKMGRGACCCIDILASGFWARSLSVAIRSGRLTVNELVSIHFVSFPKSASESVGSNRSAGVSCILQNSFAVRSLHVTLVPI